MALNNGWKAITAMLLIIVLCAAGYVVWQQWFKVGEYSDRETLFQLSPFNTFSLGKFDGDFTFAELAEHGDFGIGTLNGLDGEMIALDGIFYQVPVDGKPKQILLESKTPYATVTNFEADQTFSVSSLNYSELTAYINETLPSKNAIYAIKIQGTYDYVQARSVPKQTQPYPTLTEAIRNQSVFTLNNVSATAVGFYFPSSMDGVDFAGYHLHILTDNCTAGGHLLDCMIKSATVQIDQINKFSLVLP